MGIILITFIIVSVFTTVVVIIVPLSAKGHTYVFLLSIIMRGNLGNISDVCYTNIFETHTRSHMKLSCMHPYY